MSKTISSRPTLANKSQRMKVIIHPEGPSAYFDQSLLFPELWLSIMQLHMIILTRITWTMKVQAGRQTRQILVLKMRYRAMELRARVSTLKILNHPYLSNRKVSRKRFQHLINTRPSIALISCLRNRNKTLSRVSISSNEGQESRVRIGLAVVKTSPCQMKN